MRSRIQHSWLQWFVAACAACSVGAVACSDSDPETEIDPLQGASGNAGTASSNAGAAGSAGSGGAANGGRAGSGGAPAAAGSSAGGSAGSSAGGSANAGGGAAGAAGAAGSGPDLGGEPDAGGGEPDEEEPGEEEPEPGQFTAAFQVLQNNCVPCHADGRPLPQFAQADEDLAFAVTQGTGSGGAFIYERIIARAVTARTMPPNCNGNGTCLDATEEEVLEDWVADGALR